MTMIGFFVMMHGLFPPSVPTATGIKIIVRASDFAFTRYEISIMGSAFYTAIINKQFVQLNNSNTLRIMNLFLNCMTNTSQIDIKRKTYDIGTRISRHILHQHWYTCPIALPVRRNPQHRSLLTVVSATSAPTVQPLRHQRNVFRQIGTAMRDKHFPT
jgi:hypothetical protein